MSQKYKNTRSDIKKVVILGSGPIVIGQACEFDYSGTQACKALMKEGLEVVLINSNPATIMTDPDLASKVYIEPLKVPFIKKVLEKERPNAIIPTLGGQTALNLALELEKEGILRELNIQMLGAKKEVIEAAEDREKFRNILDKIGAQYPKSFMVHTLDEGMGVVDDVGFPIILRPNYTLGGGGSAICYSLEEYKLKLAHGLHESPTSEVLVEESILGWKEFELEVMRDKAGTFVVICSIENIDPCGVHTGDSITVAPQQTLTDREYQEMRTEACKVIEEVGVETGGANVQFAVCPDTGKRVVIEMNPRVSRSSALASKATGFPIAKIAALLAIGYELKDIQNDITKTTPSCYEPALDYVVTKIPRFAFEKFHGVEDSLGTQMKSVGEVMAIGRTFKESFQKALLSLEKSEVSAPKVIYSESKLTYSNSQRIFHIFQAFRDGFSVSEINEKTKIAPWFLEQIKTLVDFESKLFSNELNLELLRQAKKLGFSDAHIAEICLMEKRQVTKLREENGLFPRYFQVDTCAGEFQSQTPYFYSTYWASPLGFSDGENTVVLLGSGPNRIGQGIEFDYSCVRSVKRFQKEGFKVVMVNSNPETVSTDYDTADELYFEPLTSEHVGEVLRHTQPKGFVSQLGGQTPILLSKALTQSGYKMLGTSLQSMDLAEDRVQFVNICRKLNFKIPRAGTATDLNSALKLAEEIGYPLMCRPSYVIGGSRMEIVESEEDLVSYFERRGAGFTEEAPCLMDEFLERALEVDVDLVRGIDWVVIGGIIEHIEAAGVHSGDSMGVLPPQRLKHETSLKIEQLCRDMAEELKILGFLNLQLAIKNDEIYMIEANPRSSRSVPFIAKAGGVPLVDLGVKAILGKDVQEVHADQYNWRNLKNVCVKGVVFPFKKFSEADSILGPEMKSTGESMGRGLTYSEALLKALYSSQVNLPDQGEVFLSWREKDKVELLPVAKDLAAMGYTLSATSGTADFLSQHNLSVEKVNKVLEGRPHCVDRIRSGRVSFVINTTSGRDSIEASIGIRRSCVDYSIPCITESDAAIQIVDALKDKAKGKFDVAPLDEVVVL
ncbi:MAG: carbamoyl-phosphate synthase large subunit [Bdellovibrionales bacterium]|nr:carbamoyl-phosphate synthase large subunit [Bdellovibrionales bacterium]